MKREYIKKYGLKYLGINAKLTTNANTYETTDTWYSRKLHGIVANFPSRNWDWMELKNPKRSECWIHLCICVSGD
jgi:hypothetical protein